MRHHPMTFVVHPQEEGSGIHRMEILTRISDGPLFCIAEYFGSYERCMLFADEARVTQRMSHPWFEFPGFGTRIEEGMTPIPVTPRTADEIREKMERRGHTVTIL